MVIALLLMLSSLFTNTDLFVAGDFSLGYSNKRTPDSGFSHKNVSFDINPSVGYVFNGKYGVALAFGYGNYFENIDDVNELNNEKIVGQKWKIAPFFRYVICNFNDDICFYSDLSFKYTENTYTSMTSLNVSEDFSTKIMSIEVAPAMSYGLTNNLSIYAKFHFLTLGYYHTIEKTSVKTTTDAFNFGANNQTLVSAGLVYIFK